MSRVALTFDDGPGPATSALLDVLAARGTRATFFLLGHNVERAREVVIRLMREGHTVGNHSLSHPRPDATDEVRFATEIKRNDALLLEVAKEAGVTLREPIPVRLPYGPIAEDPRMRALSALGRTHVHWTADFEDWKDPQPAGMARKMREHIEQQLARGLDAVLDLHDSSREFANRAATVEAVKLLLAEPTASAWHFV
jgi:peptidoglycan-N-acetylglucosamine deacetylase